MNKNVPKIIRYLTSIHFNIPTKSIMELDDQLQKWLMFGCCGAIVYGRPRIGKTRAIQYLADSFRDFFDEESLPVIIWNMTSHAITERNFYASLLMAMGYPNPSKGGTALVLKERVLNALTAAAEGTELRKVVIMIDEAYLMDIKDITWLMDLYNNLFQNDIMLTVFMFGTEELKAMKAQFVGAGKAQIIGRFMINEYQFHGITSLEELKMCLLSFDRPISLSIDNMTEVSLAEFFFPDAYVEKHSFSSLASDLWDLFYKIRSDYHIKDTDIPMQYFITTITNLLVEYGQWSCNAVYWPDRKALEDCILKSGYQVSGSPSNIERTKNGKRRKSI